MQEKLDSPCSLAYNTPQHRKLSLKVNSQEKNSYQSSPMNRQGDYNQLSFKLINVKADELPQLVK